MCSGSDCTVLFQVQFPLQRQEEDLDGATASRPRRGGRRGRRRPGRAGAGGGIGGWAEWQRRWRRHFRPRRGGPGPRVCVGGRRRDAPE